MPSVHRLIAVAVVAGLLVFAPVPALAQAPSGNPAFRLRAGVNELSLYERFSTVIEHSANIRQVLDFDAEVIRVDTVQGNPQQIRVSALQTGVTTVSIVDEYGQQFSVEVLVRGDVRHLESFVRRLYPNDTINVEEIKGAVRLDGWVTKPEHVSEIQSIAEQFYPNVMNHMKIGGVQQVLLKCSVMEVQRSKFRRLGMNFSLVRPSSFLISTPGPITPIESLSSGGGGTTAALTGFADSTIAFGFTRPNGVFNGFVQAMRDEGLLKLHAEPMLVTHNGRPASLLNGGETPVITPAGLGTTAIEFKEFGIQLEAVPFILGNGRVRLEIEAAIRDRDFSNAINVAGVQVPAFIVRRANTQVEMNFGEALVIAGLVSKRQEGASQKIPFLGELPWIGTAFGVKQYTEAETELMIVVTPEYVAPMSSGQMPAGGPGSFTDVPTDRELFFHHLLEVPKFGEECDGCLNGMPMGGYQGGYQGGGHMGGGHTGGGHMGGAFHQPGDGCVIQSTVPGSNLTPLAGSQGPQQNQKTNSTPTSFPQTGKSNTVKPVSTGGGLISPSLR